jgi:ribitol 2-dehydrogenase
MGKVIITMPVVDRANWPAFKPATTVRADIFEDSVDAGCTECAFMAADAGLPRVGRQVLSAIFTNGAQFKHVKSPALNEARNNRTEGLGICPANCRSSGKTTLSDIHKMTGLLWPRSCALWHQLQDRALPPAHVDDLIMQASEKPAHEAVVCWLRQPLTYHFHRMSILTWPMLQTALLFGKDVTNDLISNESAQEIGPLMTQSISGKVVVVTGASSGIGRAIAQLFAAQGAQLVLAARSVDRLNKIAREIGGNSLTIAIDLAKPADVERMIAETSDHFGRIDVLMANAGVYISENLSEGDPDAWDNMIAVNVNSVFRSVRCVLPLMISQKSGDIIVTSSIAGHQAMRSEPVYSATKHALQAFVHGVRRQIAPHNIRIGSIAPGTVLNELWGVTDPAEVDRRVRLREGLRSEDVAEACLWMLTRPPNVTIRDLVMLPQNQDI